MDLLSLPDKWFITTFASNLPWVLAGKFSKVQKSSGLKYISISKCLVMITLEDIMKSVASSWKCQLIQMYCIGQIPWNVLPWWFSKWWTTLGKTLNKTKHSLPLICICWQCCSVAKFVRLFCNPMKYIMSNSPVLHYLLEFAQIHVHWVSDAL